jgi:hypothetical protein
MQKGLRPVLLRGMVEIDARKHSFFKHIIEQRTAHESVPALHYWLKILASSGSYGLFVELNQNEADAARLKVFSGEESFETTSSVVEEPGKWFAPHIGSLVTAGGRPLWPWNGASPMRVERICSATRTALQSYQRSTGDKSPCPMAHRQSPHCRIGRLP